MSTTPNVPYRLEFSVEVPGTPEQVWQAIATAKGMSAWFLPTEMEEREGGSVALWSTLHDALGLGDEGATVEVRGATGTVERVGERQTLVRLTAPVPGMLSVFAYSEGDGKATAGVRAYLFSADAADYVRREEPAWQAWLQGLSVPHTT